MNLQENINRIQSMMGIITEDKMGDVIIKMIDNVGLDNTFKMIGDYDLVLLYLTDEDKIKFIKDKVLEIADKLGSNGISLSSPQGRPLRIQDEKGVISQIEFLGQSRARVEVYDKENNVYYNSYTINYVDLSPQVMDLIIKRLMEM